MRGDFSRWRDERRHNFNGVLHQQGRVLLDADWNAQTDLTNDWQDTAARDAFGAGVAAVPADAPESFKIKTAALVGTEVRLTIAPGRVWADGLLARLDGVADVPRVATYLQPPLVTPPAPDATTIAAGVRDAVVLELWREEMNAFQMPGVLVEPALGGPDTTERVHTATAFRLLRLTDPEDTCDSIIDRLRDDFDAKGRLTVTLDAPAPVGGDCPVTDDGGYTGFEHNLYRVEIAETKDATVPMFKWSQFGGGLVGRGKFAAGTLTIEANDQAIVNSGLQEFYLEALEFEPAPPQPTGRGHWKLVYGARVTLNSATGVFSLPDPIANAGDILFGSVPAAPSSFFRLWNGVEPIADFDGPTPLPLQDGILLQFDAAANANYVAGDYWTFSVRAGEIDNGTPLVDDQPPEGIHYHRVPLGILQWQAPGAPPLIEDCRHVFQPLTKIATCCTYRVGDGTRSHGDFTSIQAAVDALPAAGGEVCVLPGVYVENVKIERRRNITIKGCGPRSRVVSPPGANNLPAAPVFFIAESLDIKILSLAVEADDTGIGLLLDGRRVSLGPNQEQVVRGPLVNVTLEDLLVRAAARCAIEVRDGHFITVRRCRVEMKDVPSLRPAVFFIGDDGLIEENEIIVNIARPTATRVAVVQLPQAALSLQAGRAASALGGLQLGGGCERVRVLNNVVARGIGIGIKLGSLVTVNSDGNPLPEPTDPDPNDCFPCRPGDNTVPGPDPDGTSRTVTEGDLHEIEIVGNRIYSMGLDGIGVAGFFPLGQIDEFISVHGLRIISNEIRFCVYRDLQEIPTAMLDAMGYGGISLADASDLVIRDNFIYENAPDFREPVCGIFVLHGEAVEISRNHIHDNGTRPPNSQQPRAGLKPGPRGGIYIRFALAPVVPITIVIGRQPFSGTGQSGIPALRVHDNVVSVPVAGRALTVTALGAVSVVGNQFSTRGSLTVDTFDGSTVWIGNLGISNEFFLQLIMFLAALAGNNQPPGGGRAGLDDLTLGRSLVGGNVLFAANQCTLDLMEAGFSTTDSSIVIITLDDLGFHANQCECNLLDDFVLAQAILLAVSLRASDNRFKENMSADGRQFLSLFSAITLGIFFNTTTDNQSTRCLWIRGLPNLTVDHSNVSLVMLSNPSACCDLLVNQRDCFARAAGGRGTVIAVDPATPPNQAVTTVTLARG